MQAVFAFGKTGLTVSLPDGPRYSVVEGRSACALEDAAAAIGAALDHPIGWKPLVELAAGKRTAAISVCDITRPAPNRSDSAAAAQAAARRGHSRGWRHDPDRHRPAPRGDQGRDRHRFSARRSPRAIAWSTTTRATLAAIARWARRARGTPVYIDERFLAADLHITLGFIEPHCMLGFSGGRKLIVPGAGRAGDHQGDSLAALHARAAGHRGLDRGQSAARGTAGGRCAWRATTSCST